MCPTILHMELSPSSTLHRPAVHTDVCLSVNLPGEIWQMNIRRKQVYTWRRISFGEMHIFEPPRFDMLC